MKTLTMPPSSDENLRILPTENKIKSTDIQEILSINNENDNRNTNSSSVPSR